jgi:hypothetical protein
MIRFNKFLVIIIITATLVSQNVLSVFAATYSFSDIKGHWAEVTIKWATEQKLVQGYEDGTFRPDNIVTEAEFLAILLRLYPNAMEIVKKNPSTPNNWTYPYYVVAKQFNMPLAALAATPIARGHVAELIVGAFGNHYDTNGAIAFLYDMGLSNGRNGKTLRGYEVAGNLTRAEAAQFVKSLSEKVSTLELKKRPDEELQNPSVSKYYLSNRVANYNIQVSVDGQHKTLTGTETIKWKNPAKGPVKELYFHMYPNAFESTNTTFWKERLADGFPKPTLPDDLGNIQISRMETEQGEQLTSHMQFVQPDDGNQEDRTLLKVDLPYTVPPEGTIKITMQFSVQLPQLHRRMGHTDEFVMAGQWFPKIAVYEPSGTRGRMTDGWHLHQFHANSQFYADFGEYDVSIDCPASDIVAATGSEVSAKPIGRDIARHYFHAGDVHDFAWAASPNFMFSEAPSNSGTTIKLYLDPKHAHLKSRYMQAAQKSLQKYREWYGEYPYPSLSIIAPPAKGKHAGRMQYPTLITASAGIEENPDLNLERVIAHEIAHQYWYGMVANDEFEEPWLDEGFASYAEEKLMTSEFGIDPKQFYRPSSPTYNRLTKYSWQYKNYIDYVNNVYIGGKHVLQEIEQKIGSEKMQEVMKVYFERWKFKHPGTKDFKEILEHVTQQNWQEYFASSVYGNS